MVKFLTYTCICVLMTIFVYLLVPKKPVQEHFCGVTSEFMQMQVVTSKKTVEEWLGKVFQEENGKRIFTEHCSGCHRIGARLVGPGFNLLPTKFENANWIKSYILNSDSLLLIEDERAIALKEDFNNQSFKHHFFKFSEEELTDLIGYIAQW